MKRIIAVVVLMFIAILSGCATNNINFGDPDRPLPPQPIVSASIRAQLTGKSLKSFKVYTGNVVYYDASPLIERSAGMKKWEAKSFTKDLAKTNNPPTQTVVAAYQFLKAFRARLQEEGYTVVDTPCNSCLRLDIDFATVVVRPNGINYITVILERTRVFFKNTEVLSSGDDLMAGAKQGVFASEEERKDVANRMAAIGFTHELERSWNMVFQGEKVSME